MGYQSLQKAHYLKQRLLELPGLSSPFSAPSFREFAIRCAVDWAEMNRRLLDYGFLGEAALGQGLAILN